MVRFALGVASLVAGLAACATPGDDAIDGVDGKADGASSRFIEVDPTHTNTTFRTYITRALDMLEEPGREVAHLTASSIAHGYVKVDELADLTCADFLHVIKDLPDLNLKPTDYAQLKKRGSPITAAIQGELDGYMWANHVYVARSMDTRHLAATLVHEVNHVVNRSEVGYYDDLPTSAFLHEYRAFYAESLFEPEPYEGVNLVDYVIESYELDRSKIPAAVLASPLTPVLLPTSDAWRERDVTADVDEVADCTQ